MKSVLISIQPKWCELIASGKKTVEVRKNKPKLKTPFKVYIYCTQGEALAVPSLNNPRYAIHRTNNGTLKGKRMTAEERQKSDHQFANGKVIGEFVCDFIDAYCYDYCPHPEIGMNYDCGDNWWEISEEDLENACLTYEDFKNYAWCKKVMYGWHISDLKIYDEPKELSEFRTPCKMTDGSCYFCDYAVHGMDGDLIDCNTSLTRPPQSWCYVEGE